METSEEVWHRLRTRVGSYMDAPDRTLVGEAYACAARVHQGQLRRTGEPFICHPLLVAETLSDLEADPPTIAAAILHDSLELSAHWTLEGLQREFGREISGLVDGVTKLRKVHFDEPTTQRAEQADNLRKLLISISEDYRVILIKLADRLHNMRTLHGFDDDPEKQRRIALETMRIHAPLAHRFGIWNIKWQLEDLAFRYLESENYRLLAARVAKTRTERERETESHRARLEAALREAGLPAQVSGRPKHLWSVYTKMERRGLQFAHIYDLLALRVLVDTVSQCYEALGIIHTQLWTPVQGAFSDYIASPKPNGYQSLHSKVLTERQQPVEIQIRTHQMHWVAEYGLAAHWKYKEETKPGPARSRKEVHQEHLGRWLRQLGELQSDAEFLAAVGVEFTEPQVFVFTPKREVIALPAGSTPVDFAYRIHSDIGDHCAAAKISGKLVALDCRLRNGDAVEIVTNPKAWPRAEWLSFVRTAHAKQKVRTYLNKLRLRDSVRQGRELIEAELERRKLERARHMEEVANVVAALRLGSEEKLYETVALGRVSAAHVVNRLQVAAGSLPPHQAETLRLVQKRRARPTPPSSFVLCDGLRGIDVRFAKCCAPIPGDEIVGSTSRGRGLVVHRRDCHNVRNRDASSGGSVVQVSWDEEALGTPAFEARLHVVGTDRVGLLHDVTSVIAEMDTNIVACKVATRRQPFATIELVVAVPGSQQVERIISRLTGIPDVTGVRRR